MSILPVSRSLIDRFNQAASLARQGRFESSLALWDALLDDPRLEDELHMASGPFLAVVYMRRAWVLMDLGQMEAAREAFEAPIMQALRGQLGIVDLYEWFFSYGNTLGLLGDIAGMEQALGAALRIAVEDLRDLARCRAVWRSRLAHAARAGALETMSRDAAAALVFARNTRSAELEAEATSYLALAEVAPRFA